MKKYQKDLAKEIARDHKLRDDQRTYGKYKDVKRHTDPTLINVPGWGWLTEFFELLNIFDRTGEN